MVMQSPAKCNERPELQVNKYKQLHVAVLPSRLERGTHNAEVGGSSPPVATNIINILGNSD